MCPTPIIARARPLRIRRVKLPGLSPNLSFSLPSDAFVANPVHRIQLRGRINSCGATRSASPLGAKRARSDLMCDLLRIDSRDPHGRIVREAIEPMWATSTWATRERLWVRMNKFCAQFHLSQSALSAVQFVDSLKLATSTKLAYARNL